MRNRISQNDFFKTIQLYAQQKVPFDEISRYALIVDMESDFSDWSADAIDFCFDMMACIELGFEWTYDEIIAKVEQLSLGEIVEE